MPRPLTGLLMHVALCLLHAQRGATQLAANSEQPCTQLMTPTACCAVPECGWCAESYTCMAGDEDGPDASSVGCDCNSWCGGTKTYQECKDDPELTAVTVLAPAIEIEVPVDSDIRCLNGGSRLWFNYSTCPSPPCNDLNPDVPVFGNAMCKCPDDWTGVDCGLCTRDDQCSEFCNRYINPEESSITCELVEFGEAAVGYVLSELYA